MKLPDYPIEGEPCSASWGRRLVDYLRAITLRSTPSMKVSILPGGTTATPRIPSSQSVEKFKVRTYPDPEASWPPYLIVPYRRAFMAATLREYDENGGLVPIGSETYPLAENHSLQWTTDWIRIANIPENE